MTEQINPNNSSPTVLKQLEDQKFRVSVFGSARLEKGHPSYDAAFELGQGLAEKNIDVITGGGPGIMEAAAAGHKVGRSETEAKTIGIGIELPFEQGFNEFMEIKKEFRFFSDRLDQFMLLSNVVVVMDGGIGTALELFYTWQLEQVKHICNIPIIVVGPQWRALIEWVKDYLNKDGYISEEDLNSIFVVDTVEEILNIVVDTQKAYEEQGDKFCVNSKFYQAGN